MITDIIYKVLSGLLLTIAVGLGVGWFSSHVAEGKLNTQLAQAEVSVKNEQLTSANLRADLAKQNAAVQAMGTAKAEADKRAATLRKSLAAAEKRNADALATVMQVDASKVESCDDAMPVVDKVLAGAKP